MSSVKFHHVYAALLVLSTLSAFVIPERYTARAQPQVQSLFYPVARPVGAVAGWFGERVKPAPRDARDAQTLIEENERLKQELALVTTALQELRLREGERKRLGDLLRARCEPVPVAGPELSGRRDALLLRGSTLDGLREGQPVLSAGGLVGRLEKPPGLAGAQVRLITDRGFRVEAKFARFGHDADGKPRLTVLGDWAVVVEGLGQSAMRCVTDLTMQDVTAAGLRVNDYVALNDSDWDDDLQGYRIGRVSRIAPQAAAPLYADIRIEPATSLLRLREVMVVTK